MYLKFSVHAYFRTRNSNLKSVSNKNQLEISRNYIRDNVFAKLKLTKYFIKGIGYDAKLKRLQANEVRQIYTRPLFTQCEFLTMISNFRSICSR